MTDTPKIVARLAIGKETVRAQRYEETPEAGMPPVVGTQYIQKFALERIGNPRRIKITIEPDEG